MSFEEKMAAPKEISLKLTEHGHWRVTIVLGNGRIVSSIQLTAEDAFKYVRPLLVALS